MSRFLSPVSTMRFSQENASLIHFAQTYAVTITDCRVKITSRKEVSDLFLDLGRDILSLTLHIREEVETYTDMLVDFMYSSEADVGLTKHTANEIIVHLYECVDRIEYEIYSKLIRIVATKTHSNVLSVVKSSIYIIEKVKKQVDSLANEWNKVLMGITQ